MRYKFTLSSDDITLSVYDYGFAEDSWLESYAQENCKQSECTWYNLLLLFLLTILRSILKR